jgi:hypothetical protein
MTLTRQHFQLIADVVKRTNVDDTTRKALAYDFAFELRRTNPKFDTNRFLVACGVEV